MVFHHEKTAGAFPAVPGLSSKRLKRCFILMRNFNASKALSNFVPAQGAGAQAKQRYVKLPATQCRGKMTDATMR